MESMVVFQSKGWPFEKYKGHSGNQLLKPYLKEGACVKNNGSVRLLFQFTASVHFPLWAICFKSKDPI